MNDSFSIVFLIIFFLMCFGCLIFPVFIIKGLFLWPKTIKKMIRNVKFSPENEEAIKILDFDQKKFAQKYGCLLSTIRITGVIGIILVILSFCRYINLITK